MPDDIEFWLYDPLNVTSLGKLDHSWDRKWSDPLNDAGGGSFSIPADEAIAAAQLMDGSGNAVYNKIVRCRLNGTDRFAWIVRENKKGTAKAGEEVDRFLEIAGPGTLAFFGSALVYPERGIGRISPDNRLFNWTSRDYNDTAWVAATQVKQQSAVVTLNSWNGLPLGWADPTAYWIWNSAGAAASNVPNGDVYFRKSFTLASPTTAVLSFTGDDGADVYLDNARIANKDMDKGHSWPSIARVDLVLDAGAHLLAVKGSNVTLGSLPSGVLNIAGVLLALNVNSYGTTMPGNTDYGAVILHSDSSWKCLGYPVGGPPGMTPGEILRILFTEAQTRGALAGVTWSFTDANDSNGNPWTVIPDFGVGVGTTYYAVLRQLAEIACDLRMNPTSLRLDVYNRRGSSTAVSLTVGTDVTDASHEGDGDLANAALLRFNDGWREVTSAASITTGGRFESFLSLGTAPSQEQGTRAAQALFADHANPRDAVVVTHEGRVGSGKEPYVNYDVGDTISVPSRAGGNRTERVKAITVSEDAEGFPVYTPEVQALSAVLEERLQRWLKRMSMGTHAGQSENASPYVGGTASMEKGAIPAPPTGGGKRYATVVVAASDSLHATAADADFICTGTNDHTTILAAFASIPVSGSGRVLLMEGTYNIAGRCTPSTSNDPRSLSLEGQGWSTVLNLTASVTGIRLVDFTMDKTTTASCAVKNLRIYGNGFTCSRAVSVAGANAAIEHVLVQQLNCTLTCFAWTGASNGTVLIDCKARNVTGGNAAFAGSEKHALIRCTVDNITGNAYDGTGGDACVMVGCDFEGAVVNLEGQAVLVGNKFEAVTDIGSANVIAGNKITNITLSGQLAVVHGNKISGVMTITATGDTNSVLANYFGFTGVGGTAVTVQSGATDNTIVGNVFRGYATAISDSGTNTSTDYSGGAAGDNVVY